MKILLMLLALTITTSAFAGPPKKDKKPPTPPVVVNVTKTPINIAPKQTMGQSQDQMQQQQQGQEQSQSQIADASNEGVNQTVNFGAKQQVASAIAPGIYATNPCALGGSAALGLKHVNLGGGKAKIDPECVKREVARLLGSFGERDLAVMMICSTEAAVAALGDQCVPHQLASQRITQLEDRINVLLVERAHDREVCNESKDRILEGCRK